MISLKKTKRFPSSLMEQSVDSKVLDILGVSLDTGSLEALLLLVNISKIPAHVTVEMVMGTFDEDTRPYFEGI